MNALSPSATAQPFFLKGAGGGRFCLFHPPQGGCRGGLLYLHPFGEEMNKSRRMAALQARALAAQGIGVLQLDLAGCGDSSGDFNTATWETWLDDVTLGRQWLSARLGRPVGLWGLRLGALLALDHARLAPQPPERLLLWHPVHSGAAYLNQFLRLRVANAMLADDGAPKTGTAALREALRAAPLEVAGYELAPALADALERLELAPLAPQGVPVSWLDLVGGAGRGAGPATARVAREWQERGVALALQAVPGPQFWGTQEISISPELLAATSALYTEVADVV